MKKLLTILTVLTLMTITVFAIGNDRGVVVSNAQILDAVKEVRQELREFKIEVKGEFQNVDGKLQAQDAKIDILFLIMGAFFTALLFLAGQVYVLNGKISKVEGEVERENFEREPIIVSMMEKIKQLERMIPNAG